jgi:hypothetical protein
MHRVDGGLAFGVAAHGDKREAAGALRFPVHDHVDVSNRAVSTKGVAQIVFSGLEGEISYLEFHGFCGLLN